MIVALQLTIHGLSDHFIFAFRIIKTLTVLKPISVK